MKPRIYRRQGKWWVRCKHGDPTGPYRSLAVAFAVAQDIAWPKYPAHPDRPDPA